MKKNGLPIHITMWMKQKCIISERSFPNFSCIEYDSVYLTFLQKQQYKNKTHDWFPGAGVGQKLTLKGQG